MAGEPLGAPLGQVLSGLGITLPSTGTWTTVPVPTLLAADANSPGVRGISSSDNTGSPIRGVDNSFNYQILRGELEPGVHLTNDLTLISRSPAIYHPGSYAALKIGSTSRRERFCQ